MNWVIKVAKKRVRCHRGKNEGEKGVKTIEILVPGADFSYILRKIPRKFPPPQKKCGEKLQFSAEKVLKNHFFNKFHGIFRGKSLSMGKNVQKIGPRRRLLKKGANFFSAGHQPILCCKQRFC
jgi:hypothetical protein